MLLHKRIPFRYILNKIKYDLIYVLAFSFLAYFLSNRFIGPLPDLELSIPAFIGTAISILLSFKLNQSYDRWWEARKIWGSIVNDSRSLVIQLLSLVKRGNDVNRKKTSLSADCLVLFLGTNPERAESYRKYRAVSFPRGIRFPSKHANKPLAMMNFHGLDVAKLKEENQLEIFSQIQLDRTLVRLVESMGMAERIKNTVFPVTYKMFLHFSIYLFVATLAIALKEMAFYYQVPLSLLVSSIFFLLEKSARHMQDPFENKPTDTSVTAIARTIEINIRHLLGEQKVPASLEPTGFYMK